MLGSEIKQIPSESAATVHQGTVEPYIMYNTEKVNKGKTTEEIDDEILRANGHEAVLERQFSWISALGLGFSITNSWVGYLVSSLLVQPNI